VPETGGIAMAPKKNLRVMINKALGVVQWG
jgi:hypothetical protein